MGNFWLRAGVCSLAVVVIGAAPGGAPIVSAPQNGPGGATIRTDLLELLGADNATTGQVGEVATLLMEKRQLVVVALAGKKAPLESLRKEVEVVVNEAERAINADETVAAIAKGLDLLQHQLTAAQNAGASPLEIAARQLDVSHQSGMLADRRETIRMRVRAGTLPELMRCEVEANADIAELSAEMVSIDAQIAKAAKAESAAHNP